MPKEAGDFVSTEKCICHWDFDQSVLVLLTTAKMFVSLRLTDATPTAQFHRAFYQVLVLKKRANNKKIIAASIWVWKGRVNYRTESPFPSSSENHLKSQVEVNLLQRELTHITLHYLLLMMHKSIFGWSILLFLVDSLVPSEAKTNWVQSSYVNCPKKVLNGRLWVSLRREENMQLLQLYIGIYSGPHSFLRRASDTAI